MSRRISHFILLFVSMLSLAPVAHATIRYASVSGTSGNPCSQGSPCPLQTGISGMASGDTLYLRGGTYDAQIGGPNTPPPSGGGSWATATIIAGYPGETAILKPSSGGGVIVFNTGAGRSYIVFDNLVIDGLLLDTPCSPNGDVGVFFGGNNDHLRLQNSEVRNAPTNNIFSSSSASFVEVLNSRVHDACQYGFYMSGHDSLFDGNQVYNNGGYAFHIFDSGSNTVSNNTLRNNVIYGNGFGVLAEQAHAGSQNAVILSNGSNNAFYNNLVYGNANGVTLAYSFGTNLQAYNNTIYNNWTGLIVHTSDTGTSNHVYVENNIVYSNRDANFIDTVNDPSHITFAANLCDRSGLGCTIIGNPNFTNAGANDFTLQPGSAAIDAGVNIPSVTSDITGRARPQNNVYDIGAYESLSGGGGGIIPQVGVYYIASTGDDTRTCATAQTITTPKRTLNNTLPCGASGSTFYLIPGTYLETIDTTLQPIAAGISWANPTTIAAYGSGVVTLQATSGIPVIFLRNPATDHYLVFDKLHLDGFNISGTNGLATYPGVDHIRFQYGEIKRTYYESAYINQGSNIEIYGSSMHDVLSSDIVSVIGNANSILHGNTIFSSAKGGISAPGTINSNIEISSNIIYATGTVVATPAIVIKDGGGGLVSNNALYGNNAGIQVLSPSAVVRVYNNTITGNTNIGLQVDPGASGSLLTNNIVYSNGSSILNNGSGTVQTTNLTTDPLFVNASVNNYQLQPGSAAKNTGTTLSDVPLDILNIPRPSGAYDKGAYEFVGGSAPTRPPTGLILLGLN